MSTTLRARPVGVATVGGALSVTTGLLLVRSPALAVAGAAVLVLMSLLVLRLDLAVLAYVAVEPVGDLLPAVGGVSPVRLAGAALFAAWLVRCLIDSRPVDLRHAAVPAAGALLLVVLASTALNPQGSEGLSVASRYVSYVAALVVLVDSMRHRVRPWQVVSVFVWSCTAAAVLGLAVYLRDGGRAAGPQQDPNDLAFFLVAAIPLTIASVRGSRPRRIAHAAAVLVLLAGTAATFSRGAVLALAVGVIVALGLRLLALRHVVAGGVVLAVLLGAAWASAPALVDRSVSEKQAVSQANVDSRFESWLVAARMTADHPLLGTGPAGFRHGFADYEGRTTTDPRPLDVAHQMLLDVSSELGLLGLAAFVTVLGAGLASAWRAANLPPPVPSLRSAPSLQSAMSDRLLGAAVLTSFATTLTAAVFLSEQYYLPLWLLVALAAAVDPRTTTPRRPPCASSS